MLNILIHLIINSDQTTLNTDNCNTCPLYTNMLQKWLFIGNKMFVMTANVTQQYRNRNYDKARIIKT